MQIATRRNILKRIKFFYSLFFVVLSVSSNAQQPVLQWAKVFFGTEAYMTRDLSNGRSIGVDAKGNVYSVGLFMNIVDFDPGAGVFTITGAGLSDWGIYISKLSPSGDFIWAKQLPILVDWSAIEMAVDAAGNVYVTSTIGAPADMDPGPGVQMMTPIGSRDAFVVKLDTDGNLQWAKQFGATDNTAPFGTTINVDKNGDVIACGSFNNTVDFDPGPGIFNMTTTATEAYIVKLNSSGDLVWGKEFGNYTDLYGNVSITDVKCDVSGNIYTTGAFNETSDFDPGPNSFTLSGSGGFVAKLDPNGNFVWAKKIGTSENQYMQPNGIDLDSKNNVYTVGSFGGTGDFDGGPGVYNLTSYGGTFDPYLLKMNSDGNFIWAKDLGGNGLDYGFDLVIDNADNVYVSGLYDGSVDFDPGPGVFERDNLYDNNALTKFDRNGNFIYASVFDGGIFLRKLAADNLNNIFSTGYFGGIADFDPGAQQYLLTSSPDESPYVLKIAPCKNVTTDTLNVITCKAYSLNNIIFDSTVSYTMVMPNSYGCDSIITLNLTVNRLSHNLNKTICEGETYFAAGAAQSTPGIYIDTLKTNDGCDSILTTYLSVNPKPQPGLGPDRSLCKGDKLIISPGKFAKYLWQDNSTMPAFTIDTIGLYRVKVTDTLGCSAGDSVIIDALNPVPQDFLKPVDSICSNDKLQLQPFRTFQDYLWSTGQKGYNILVTAPGTYWLKVTDAMGCTGTDTISILSKDCITGVYFANAFTPNGDERNDYFKALFQGHMLSFKLEVFDRFGNVVFQTIDAAKGWDGRMGGLQYPTGIFVWRCSYHLENYPPQVVKGIVTLIR